MLGNIYIIYTYIYYRDKKTLNKKSVYVYMLYNIISPKRRTYV